MEHTRTVSRRRSYPIPATRGRRYLGQSNLIGKTRPSQDGSSSGSAAAYWLFPSINTTDGFHGVALRRRRPPLRLAAPPLSVRTEILCHRVVSQARAEDLLNFGQTKPIVPLVNLAQETGEILVPTGGQVHAMSRPFGVLSVAPTAHGPPKLRVTASATPPPNVGRFDVATPSCLLRFFSHPNRGKVFARDDPRDYNLRKANLNPQ